MSTITTSSASETSTAVIPLTTVFTPPAGCDKHHWVSSKCLESTCKGIYNIVRATDESCFPSGWAKTATGFSPGLSCPHNYSIGTSDVVVFGVGATETHATCCPSGYRLATKSPQVWYTPEPCMSVSTGTTIIEYTIVGVTPSATTQVTYVNPIIHAYPVGLTYRSTDNASPTSTPPSSSATPTATPTELSPAGSGSGLSTGAKVGIGVGVGVGALILLALAFFLLFRWKKNQKEAGQAKGPAQAPSPAYSPGPSQGSYLASSPTAVPVASTTATAWSEPPSGGSISMTKESHPLEPVKLPPQPGFRASELPGSNPHVAELDSEREPPLPPFPSSPETPVRTYSSKSQFGY